MVPEPTNNHKKNNNNSADQRQLDREVRDMLSTLTNRLTGLHSNNKSFDHQSIHVGGGGGEDEEEHGVRIITLAGTNMGATMKAESSDDQKSSYGISPATFYNEAMTAYANSNFQAINNSIMLGGSYKCKDPGVHMETSDYLEETHRHHRNHKNRNNKGKSHEHVGGTSSSKKNSTSSDESSSSDSDDN
ncbi:hypothetical protein C5167_008400 [Papaver somniferum]|uniref:Uncharacterized protein n=1 Tax=Papaver somniferum TaxID=3469 RepID=A0A4Y7JVH9_PAPSO|nr:hypothetical protein C5167_008400 [Papaver somniferum]